jgi:glycerate dehydrogenase
MKVLIAERKDTTTTSSSTTTSTSTRPGRTPFEKVLKSSTTLFLTCPLDTKTHNMLSHHELSLLHPTSLLINVGRGGIVNELALATALREGKLGGAGVDVFEHEPATKENCPLLVEGVPNLVCTPHLAWFSQRTIQGTKEMVTRTIEAFVGGNPVNVVV